MNAKFWRGKKVLITGHTGFQGAWLSFWLWSLGAEVIGYSLKAPTNPSLFKLLQLDKKIRHIHGNLSQKQKLSSILRTYSPHFVFHLAGQSILLESFQKPFETFVSNSLGTASLLECLRLFQKPIHALIITSDKCYQTNAFDSLPETTPLKGYDPYSSSKVCAEIMISAYTQSFYKNSSIPKKIVSIRTGNVMGGGDWGKHRLLPHLINSLELNKPITLRNPSHIRPWIFILDALDGYLALAEYLYFTQSHFPYSWNFGGNLEHYPVSWITNSLIEIWKKKTKVQKIPLNIKEEPFLSLDCNLAKKYLHWKPRLSILESIRWIVEWHQAIRNNKTAVAITKKQITFFEKLLSS